MKSLLCVTVVLYAFVLVQCEVVPELKSILTECEKEWELTDESLISPNFEDHKVKYFAACVLKKDGHLIGDKLSLDQEVAAAPKYMADRIDDSLKDKMTECVNRANEEKDFYELAGVFYKCLTEKFGTLYP